MDKTSLVDTLTATRAEWEALLAQFTDEWMLQAGAAGDWSVKDVIAHVTWGELEMVLVPCTHELARSELCYNTNRCNVVL